MVLAPEETDALEHFKHSDLANYLIAPIEPVSSLQVLDDADPDGPQYSYHFGGQRNEIRKHQKEGVETMLQAMDLWRTGKRTGKVLGDEQGLGKTRTILALL